MIAVSLIPFQILASCEFSCMSKTQHQKYRRSSHQRIYLSAAWLFPAIRCDVVVALNITVVDVREAWAALEMFEQLGFVPQARAVQKDDRGSLFQGWRNRGLSLENTPADETTRHGGLNPPHAGFDLALFVRLAYINCRPWATSSLSAGINPSQVSSERDHTLEQPKTGCHTSQQPAKLPTVGVGPF